MFKKSIKSFFIWWDVFKSLIYVVLIFSLLITLSIFLINYSEKCNCRNIATKMNLNYSYGINQGCMVEIEKSKWIDMDHVYYIMKKD